MNSGEQGEAVRVRRVVRWRGGDASDLDDDLVVEEPLEIRVGDRQFSVTMRTPGHDFELTRGLLLTEGVIRGEDDIAVLRYCDVGEGGENVVTVHLKNGLPPTRRWQRHLMAGTSCGLCGKAAIEAVAQEVRPLSCSGALSREVLSGLGASMRRRQNLFTRTGGLHAVGLFRADGECLCVFEDIGRHNATDKAIGFGVASGWLPWTSDEPLILLVSGRASFEITQKALLARIPVVCSVSAASSLAAELADANNQTLVGFLRDSGMTVYAGAFRLAAASDVKTQM